MVRSELEPSITWKKKSNRASLLESNVNEKFSVNVKLIVSRSTNINREMIMMRAKRNNYQPNLVMLTRRTQLLFEILTNDANGCNLNNDSIHAMIFFLLHLQKRCTNEIEKKRKENVSRSIKNPSLF